MVKEPKAYPKKVKLIGANGEVLDEWDYPSTNPKLKEIIDEQKMMKEAVEKCSKMTDKIIDEFAESEATIYEAMTVLISLAFETMKMYPDEERLTTWNTIDRRMRMWLNPCKILSAQAEKPKE